MDLLDAPDDQPSGWRRLRGRPPLDDSDPGSPTRGEPEDLDDLDDRHEPHEPHEPDRKHGAHQHRRLVLMGAVAAAVGTALGMYLLGRRDGAQVATAAAQQRLTVIVASDRDGGMAYDSNDGRNGDRMVAPVALTVVNAGAPVTVTGLRTETPGLEFLPLGSPLVLDRGHSVQMAAHLAMACNREKRPDASRSSAVLLVRDDQGEERELPVDLAGALDYAVASSPDCDDQTPLVAPVVRSWRRLPAPQQGIATVLELHNLTDRDVVLHLTAPQLQIRTATAANEFRVPASTTISVEARLAMPDCSANLVSVLSGLTFETGLVMSSGSYSPRWGGQLDLPNDAAVALLATCGPPPATPTSSNAAGAR
ncbi:MAG: hypothetical protein ACTHK1_08115 [Actinomycetales bacterium]